MSKYFKDGNKIRISPTGATEVFDNLPVGSWVLRFDPFTGFFLEGNPDFTLPDKIFGDIENNAIRVLKTYSVRNCNTGVLLSGDKGSGKTMFARLLSEMGAKQGIPTVIVNEKFEGDGFNKFLSSIEDRCIVIFDEFEKVYNDSDQNSILSLFDGMYQSNKLFILTVNNLWKVSEFIINRPGRVYYHIRYNGVEEDFIRDYCNYYLINKGHTESFINLAKMIGAFNFDMLKAVVQECNIHSQSPNEFFKIMNIDLDKRSIMYDFVLFNKGGDKMTGKQSIAIESCFEIFLNDDMCKESDDQYAHFQFCHMTKFDKDKGSFIFENTDGFTLELKRKEEMRADLTF